MIEPLVSVVLPIFNVEKYLDRCIESVVGQTYKNLEIILVDDGSTDSCPQKCDEWAIKDSRIKVIHKKNDGAGKARTTGIDCAKGSYVIFVDSDDYVDFTMVYKGVNVMQKNEADVVLFGRYDVLTNGSIKPLNIPIDKFAFENSEITNDLLPGLFTYKRGMGLSVWGKMFNLELIKKHKISFVSERDFFSEDAIFTLEFFSYVKKAIILPENLYYYCYISESLSRTYDVKHQQKADAFIKKVEEICSICGYPTEVFNSACVRYHMYSIAGMKHVISSNLSKKEKKLLFYNFFHNALLRNTMNKSILSYESKNGKIFWILFKLKIYFICYIALKFKTKR